MSNYPRFSIVIPTCERHETLKYTLQTCLAQDFEDYEVIVCDNFSSKETKEVVDSYESDKIKYVRSEKLLAMTENWNLAISYAVGEYIIFLGDDDGLLINALSEIDRQLKKYRTKALRWEIILYNWPNMAVIEDANSLIITLSKTDIKDSRKAISNVINFKQHYNSLPMLYNSAIHKDVITLLSKITQKVFKAPSPDIYSGFAIAYLLKNYVSLGIPMTIAGLSGKSNGVATLYLKGKSDIAQSFVHLNNIYGITHHPTVPNLPLLNAAISDSFQHAKDQLFPLDNALSLDRKKLITLCLKDLKPENQEEWENYKHEINKSIKDNPTLVKWFNKKSLRVKLRPMSSGNLKYTKIGDKYKLITKASKFGAFDVYSIANLCQTIFDSVDYKEADLSIYRRIRTAARILVKGY